MKRLVDENDAAFGTLSELLRAAEPHRSNPFAKRLVQSRLARALEGGPRRLLLRPVLLGAGAVFIAASAAAAGYTWLAPTEPARVAPPVAPVVPPHAEAVAQPLPARGVALPESPVIEKGSEPTRAAKPQPGEDPTQVAEAVRALRKQGDPARAQQLLDSYLRSNPRGALAEDALALSIEAAAARKDPRAADYARRYLARYPNGRFRAVAQRALAR